MNSRWHARITFIFDLQKWMDVSSCYPSRELSILMLSWHPEPLAYLKWAVPVVNAAAGVRAILEEVKQV